VNATLAVIGIVFIGAAAVGGGLKAFNIEFPILASPRRQLLLAAVGVVALAVAFVAPRLNTSAPESGSSPNNLSSSPQTTVGASTSSTATSTAAVSAIAFTGPVGISFAGTDFDTSPPGQGSDPISWERYTNTLTASGSGIVSRYDGSQVLPTEAACRTWALSHNSPTLSGVNRGDRLCFISQNGRTVRFIVTNITSSSVEGQATVWNDSNQ
jgi:hypothetical protein